MLKKLEERLPIRTRRGCYYGQVEEQAEKKIDPAGYKYVNGKIVKIGDEDDNAEGFHTAREKNYAEWKER